MLSSQMKKSPRASWFLSGNKRVRTVLLAVLQGHAVQLTTEFNSAITLSEIKTPLFRLHPLPGLAAISLVSYSGIPQTLIAVVVRVQKKREVGL